MRGQGVPPAVDPDGGAPRDGHLELDVGRLRLVELHVPVAVGRDLLLQAVSELHHVEGRAVGRYGLRGPLLVLCLRGGNESKSK